MHDSNVINVTNMEMMLVGFHDRELGDRSQRGSVMQTEAMESSLFQSFYVRTRS